MKLGFTLPVNPTTNTIGNSKPLDAWTVISCTLHQMASAAALTNLLWLLLHLGAEPLNSWCSPTCPLNWSLIISNNWRKSMSNRSPFDVWRGCQNWGICWVKSGWLSSHCIATKNCVFATIRWRSIPTAESPCRCLLTLDELSEAELVLAPLWALVWLSASYNWLICSRVSWKN